MIPSSWTPHYRDDDNEHLGYLAPASTSTEVIPTTIFGYPLAAPTDAASAAQILESVGLSYLSDRWTLHLDHTEPIAVQILEASPSRVTVQSVDYSSQGRYGERFTFSTPEGQRIRMPLTPSHL